MKINNNYDGGLSVVIPVYNSEESLKELVTRISTELRGSGAFEIIAVNDGSRDNSLQVLSSLTKTIPELRVLDLARNFGQENALLAGFSQTKYENVVCIDDDLEHDPADIHKLLHKMNENDLDIVFARFIKKRKSIFRKMGTRLNDLMMRLVIKKPRGIALSSFYALKKSLVERVSEYSGPYPYLAGQYLSATNRIGNVDLEEHPRLYQRSNYSYKKLLSIWVNGFVNFSLTPLRIIFWIGIGLFIISFILVVLVIINRLIFGNLVPLGWTSVMIAILFFASTQMMAIGLLGEYLGRVLMATLKRPRYFIRQTISDSDHNSDSDSHRKTQQD